MIRIVLLSLVLATGITAAIGIAGADGKRPRHRQPPPEAITACDGKAAGDACSFTLRDHTISGSCRRPPDTSDGPLACVPDRPPGPPPEAVEACRDKSAGDTCSVTHDGHHFDGICGNAPDGNGPLACMPER